MTEVDTPIDVGALYREVGTAQSDSYTFIRVTRLWVDEDLNTVVQYETERIGRTIDSGNTSLDNFVERINNDEIARHNSDHEAWEWRQ